METAIVFLPLLGALIAGFGAPRIGVRGSQWVSCTFMVISMVLSWIVLTEFLINGASLKIIHLANWVEVSGFNFNWEIRIDTLTAIMFFVVTSVSTVVHIYSIGYMAHDPHIPRFMAYLSLFTFMMLMLVSANNLVQLFFGWEGVGLASYLLIGFWYKRPSANAAAMKAFLVNRVGDVGFALGIFGMFWLTGSIYFDDIFASIATFQNQNILFLGQSIDAITIICLLLFLGAMGKSAQLGLHTWLPDAMEGPTPVSALIHAATMVTAGVFMLCRLSPVFEYSDTILQFVAFIGAATAFFAATIGLTQNDIKRVIAYSTCSQLGYMFFAIGVSAYPAAMFHLTTHAFFKALLFLGAGSVIHAMSDEQDMRKMGGIWRHIPVTYSMMWIGSLALAGVPFFAGYYSKDIILEAAFATHTTMGLFAFWMGIAAALMTAFYSWRLLFMTFHGKANADEKTMAHIHESPKVMTFPLGFLAIGAVISGFVFYDFFVGQNATEFWGDSILILEHHQGLQNAHHVPLWVKLLPIIVGVLGILLAWWLYISSQNAASKIAHQLRPLYLLSFNKWYFDEIYHFLFVMPLIKLGHVFWIKGDIKTIDRFGPDGIASMVRFYARQIVKLQSGYLYHYAMIMLIGVVLFSGFVLFWI
ncbi:MAG: NADH-quinone oxidoreductase subunit L [Pseudomonadota bacterium]